MGEMRSVHSILVRKPEEMRQITIHVNRWEDVIKVDLRETD
jgi:hypothetical protein